MKIEDLKAKVFNKNDLLVIFIPSEYFQDMLDSGLQTWLKTLNIEDRVLLLSDFCDVKKIDFIGSADEKVEYVETHDDVVYIKFVKK